MVQDLTFPHEVGHILGAVHDINRNSGSTPGFATYSYGYRVATVARDIMADPRCVDSAIPGEPATCTDRVPQYSNPLANFPTGRVSGTTAQNDVVRTIRQLAEGTGSLYPIGQVQTAPDLFWNSFEF